MRSLFKFVAVTAAMFPLPFAMAQEQTFHRGTLWEVVLVNDHAASQQLPFCAIRTTLWTERRLSFEATLRARDDIRLAVRLQKDGWVLPIGESTTVNLIGPEFQARAISEIELYSDFTSEGMLGDQTIVNDIVYALLNLRKGSYVGVKFKGNEQPWGVRPMGQFDIHLTNLAYKDCAHALNELGPSIFPEAAGSSATSPFGQAPEETGVEEKRDNGMTIQEFMAQGTADAEAASPREWTFTLHEEDWGGVCIVETKRDDLLFGFMASPSKNAVAFVEGIGIQEATAHWRADILDAHVFEGGASEYFGWLEFALPTMSLIEELQKSNKLTVEILGKGRYILDVSTAKESFAKFAECQAGNTEKASRSAE